MNYREINDYELLYMVCESDDSVEIILEKYYPIIRSKIRKWSTVLKKLRLSIEDVEQEILVAVVSAIRSYDDTSEASFYTYLMIVVENKMKNIVRSASSKKHQILEDSVSFFTPIRGEGLVLSDVLTDSRKLVEEKVEEHFLVDAIADFCYGLSIENAQIMELYLYGYSISKIALLMDVTNTQISNVMFRLKKKLRKYLIQKEILVV